MGNVFLRNNFPDTYNDSRTSTRLKRFKELKVGDGIANQGRIKIYKHHSVVTEIIEPDRFGVIELTGNSSNFTQGLSSSSNGIKATVSSCFYNFSEYTKKNKVYVYKYNEKVKRKYGFPPEKIASIFQRHGLPQSYHLLDFNCEHFVSYCITGEPFSKQTKCINDEAKQILDIHLQLVIMKDKGFIVDYCWASSDVISVRHKIDNIETQTEIKIDDIGKFLWNLGKGKLHPQNRSVFQGLDHHTIRCCCVLPNGPIVIISTTYKIRHSLKSFKHCLNIHSVDGSLISSHDLRVIGKVRDMTTVDDISVAVSSRKSIDIINFDSNNIKVVKHLDIRGCVEGLCFRERDIVCCVRGNGLVRANIDNGKIEAVKEDESVCKHSRIHVGRDLVCYTCPAINTISVLDIQYKTLFTYEDKAVLLYPLDVTIDTDHRNIFVTGTWSNNLVVFSSDDDGTYKFHYQLLGKQDGLDKPTAVHYDSTTKTLMVVSYPKFANIYSVNFVSNQRGEQNVSER